MTETDKKMDCAKYTSDLLNVRKRPHVFENFTLLLETLPSHVQLLCLSQFSVTAALQLWSKNNLLLLRCLLSQRRLFYGEWMYDCVTKAVSEMWSNLLHSDVSAAP